MYSIFKRGADILISIIALPFMLLLTIVLGILIYLEDEGPIFTNLLESVEVERN